MAIALIDTQIFLSLPDTFSHLFLLFFPFSNSARSFAEQQHYGDSCDKYGVEYGAVLQRLAWSLRHLSASSPGPKVSATEGQQVTTRTASLTVHSLTGETQVHIFDAQSSQTTGWSVQGPSVSVDLSFSPALSTGRRTWCTRGVPGSFRISPSPSESSGKYNAALHNNTQT